MTLVVAIIVIKQLIAVTIDFQGAFVTEPIKREVYVEMKSDDGKTKIYAKLLKYLYGLDDSPKAFNDGLQEYFNDSPYKQSMSEPCLYIATFRIQSTSSW